MARWRLSWTGDADLRGGAEQGARLARIAVALAEMDAVGADPLRQRHVVVDDEGDVARPRRSRCSGSASRAASCWSTPFTRNWKAATGPASSAAASRSGKVAADVERRDQIELAGRPPRVALEARGEIRDRAGRGSCGRAGCRPRAAPGKRHGAHRPMPVGDHRLHPRMPHADRRPSVQTKIRKTIAATGCRRRGPSRARWRGWARKPVHPRHGRRPGNDEDVRQDRPREGERDAVTEHPPRRRQLMPSPPARTAAAKPAADRRAGADDDERPLAGEGRIDVQP